MLNKLQEIIRNFLVWIYVIITVPIFAIFAILYRRHFWAQLWCEGLLKCLGLKIEVIIKERPKEGEVLVFMSNHQSQLDIPVLEKVLKSYNIRFLAKQSLFKIPFFGWGIRALGYVPVEREDPREGLKSLLACIERLRQGISLVIFPEGTRSKTGDLLPFKAGGFLIPLKAGVRVCPVAIWGTCKVLPKGSLWFNLKDKTIKVTIGPIIEVKGLSPKDRGILMEMVRSQIERSLEEMKKS